MKNAHHKFQNLKVTSLYCFLSNPQSKNQKIFGLLVHETNKRMKIRQVETKYS